MLEEGDRVVESPLLPGGADHVGMDHDPHLRRPGIGGRRGGRRQGQRRGAGGEEVATGQVHGGSPHSQGLEHAIPGRPVRPFESVVGVGIADDGLPGRVPAELAAEAQREVGQVAGRGDAVAALEVGDRLAARLDAVEEVAGVAAELVELVARSRPRSRSVRGLGGPTVASRSGPPTGWPANVGTKLDGGTSAVGVDGEAAARDRERPLRAAELRGRAPAGCRATPRGATRWRSSPGYSNSASCVSGVSPLSSRQNRPPELVTAVGPSRPRYQSTMSSECWPRLVICPPE